MASTDTEHRFKAGFQLGTVHLDIQKSLIISIFPYIRFTVYSPEINSKRKCPQKKFEIQANLSILSRGYIISPNVT